MVKDGLPGQNLLVVGKAVDDAERQQWNAVFQCDYAIVGIEREDVRVLDGGGGIPVDIRIVRREEGLVVGLGREAKRGDFEQFQVVGRIANIHTGENVIG